MTKDDVKRRKTRARRGRAQVLRLGEDTVNAHCRRSANRQRISVGEQVASRLFLVVTLATHVTRSLRSRVTHRVWPLTRLMIVRRVRLSPIQRGGLDASDLPSPCTVLIAYLSSAAKGCTETIKHHQGLRKIHGEVSARLTDADVPFSLDLLCGSAFRSADSV